jgi:ribosome-associated protein
MQVQVHQTTPKTGRGMQERAQVARRAVEIAMEKQATDILLLDLRDLAAFTDYFVVLTADSDRLIEALAEEMERALPPLGTRLLHREGAAASGWVLLDFGDVVVHLFAAAQRQRYRLEQVWRRAVPLVRAQ